MLVAAGIFAIEKKEMTDDVGKSHSEIQKRAEFHAGRNGGTTGRDGIRSE